MVGVKDAYDEETERFVEFGGFPVYLEHSLVSISKWEESHEKSFLSSEKTDEEMLDYIQYMILPETPNPDVLHLITQKEITEITEYMQAKRSGTTFVDAAGDRQKNEKITSEQIYSWMAAHHIDWSAENWHIQRLLNLIRICNINAQKDPNKKNSKPVSGSSAMANRRALNQARRAQSGSSG